MKVSLKQTSSFREINHKSFCWRILVENFNHEYPEIFILIITLIFTKVLRKCAGTEYTWSLKYTYMTISLRYCITSPFVRIFNLGVILLNYLCDDTAIKNSFYSCLTILCIISISISCKILQVFSLRHITAQDQEKLRNSKFTLSFKLYIFRMKNSLLNPTTKMNYCSSRNSIIFTSLNWII